MTPQPRNRIVAWAISVNGHFVCTDDLVPGCHLRYVIQVLPALVVPIYQGYDHMPWCWVFTHDGCTRRYSGNRLQIVRSRFPSVYPFLLDSTSCMSCCVALQRDAFCLILLFFFRANGMDFGCMIPFLTLCRFISSSQWYSFISNRSYVGILVHNLHHVVLVLSCKSCVLPWECRCLHFIIPAPRILLQHLIVALAFSGQQYLAHASSTCLRNAPYQYPYVPGQYHVHALSCAVNIQVPESGRSGTGLRREIWW